MIQELYFDPGRQLRRKTKGRTMKTVTMKSRSFELTEKQAMALLAGVIIARATGYLFSKICMESMGIFTLLAARSLIAFFALCTVFFRRIRRITRQELFAGCVIGILFFLTMAAELYGLQTTDTSIGAILENTAIPCGAVLNVDGKNHYTTYSCCMDTEKKSYFFKTYTGGIREIRLSDENRKGNQLIQYAI